MLNVERESREGLSLEGREAGPFPVCSAIFITMILFRLISLPGLAAEKKCEQALGLFQSGQYANAVPVLREAMATGECPSYFQLYVGISQLRLGDLKSAEASLGQFLEDYPAAANGWHQLGLVYFAGARFSDAVEAFRTSVVHDPNPEVWKFLGRALVALHRDSEAEQALSRAAELDPHDFESRYMLARLCQEKGQNQEAVTLFQASIRLNPDHVRSHAHLGTAYAEVGDDKRAVESFEKAISLNSTMGNFRRGRRREADPIPHFEFGLYYLSKGSLDEARGQLNTAVRLSPGQARPRYQLARVYFLSGELPPARTLLLEAISFDAEDPRLHNLLSQVCYKQGDRECGDEHAALSETLRRDSQD